MTSSEYRLLIEDYLKQLLTGVVDDSSFNAWRQMDLLARENPESAWEVLRDVIRQATIEQCETIGAGPLEVLLAGSGGVRVIERIAQDAANDEKVRHALRFAYLFDAPEIEQRVDEILGKQ